MVVVGASKETSLKELIACFLSPVTRWCNNNSSVDSAMLSVNPSPETGSKCVDKDCLLKPVDSEYGERPKSSLRSCTAVFEVT